MLDLSESLGGDLSPTIMMTLLTNEIPARPVLYLIDEEMPKFLGDLQELEQFLSEYLGAESNGKAYHSIINNHLPGDVSLG